MKLPKFIIILVFALSFHLYAQYDVKVEQDGNNNEILVNQSGLFNKINVLQRADNSRSVINQDGTGNVITQINENSDSGAITKQKVVQDGDYNYSRIDIDGAQTLSDYNTTISQEYGNGNEAQITSIGMKNGSNSENDLLIQQHGSNNYGDLQVYGMGLGGSIIQTGDNMSVTVIRTN